jgi:hypothetical protein
MKRPKDSAEDHGLVKKAILYTHRVFYLFIFGVCFFIAGKHYVRQLRSNEVVVARTAVSRVNVKQAPATPVKNRNVFWTHAQQGLVRGNAKALHRNPDVYEVQDFLNESVCNQLINLYDNRKQAAKQQHNTRWCFAKDIDIRARAGPKYKYTKKVKFEEFEHDLLLGGQKECTRNADAGIFLAQAYSSDRYGEKYSTSVMVAAGEDKLIDWIQEKLNPVFDRAHAYHTQIIEYETGQAYNAHTDCNGASNDCSSTVLIYLSQHLSGGETEFTDPSLNRLVVAPQKGKAIFFTSLDATGNCDQRTRHRALQITGKPSDKSRKLVLQRFYHTRPGIALEKSTTNDVVCDTEGSCRKHIYGSDGPSEEDINWARAEL